MHVRESLVIEMNGIYFHLMRTGFVCFPIYGRRRGHFGFPDHHCLVYKFSNQI